MPRIPEASVTVRLPTRVGVSPAQIAAPYQAGARAFEQVASVLGQAYAARETARRKVDVSAAATTASRGLHDLRLAALTQAPRDRGTFYDEGAGPIIDDAGAGLDELGQQIYRSRIMQYAETQGFAVRTEAFAQETKDEKARLIAAGSEYADLMAAAANDLGRQHLYKTHRQDIMLSSFFSAAEQETLLEAFEVMIPKRRVSYLLEQALKRPIDPVVAGMILDKTRRIIDESQNITPEDRLQLIAATEVVRGKVARAAAAEDDARTEAIETNYLERLEHEDEIAKVARDGIVLPPHPDGPLTEAEILRSGLEPAAIEHYIELVRRGPDIYTRTDPRVETALWRKIQAGEYTTPGQLYPYIGRGLEIDGLRRLTADMEHLANPETKEEWRQFGISVNLLRGGIDRSNDLLNIFDPMGAERFAQFRLLTRKRFEKGLAEGKDMYDMLNEASPDYIFDLLPLYQAEGEAIFERDMDSLLKERAAVLERLGPEAERRPGEDEAVWLGRLFDMGYGGTAYREGTARKPGELPEDWRARTGK